MRSQLLCIYPLLLVITASFAHWVAEAVCCAVLCCAARLANLPEVAGCEAKLRMEGDKPYVTDNSNYIVDLYFQVHTRAAPSGLPYA